MSHLLLACADAPLSVSLVALALTGLGYCVGRWRL